MTDEAKATCKATTKAGRPCRKQADERGFCLFHSGKLDLAEQGRRGGKASGEARSRKQQPEQPGDRLEGLAHTALEELLASSGSATARAAAARLVIDKMAAHSPLNAELARRAAYEAIQQQMQSQMPAVREKVTLLIERRAQALAQEMYRKRMKLETEAVKAEMAAGASRESAREDAPTRERAEKASAALDEDACGWQVVWSRPTSMNAPCSEGSSSSASSLPVTSGRQKRRRSPQRRSRSEQRRGGRRRPPPRFPAFLVILSGPRALVVVPDDREHPTVRWICPSRARVCMLSCVSPAALIAGAAGHSDFKTTQGYIDLAGETFREEAKLADERLFGAVGQKPGQT